MHRVGTRGERHAGLTAIGRGAGVLAIHHIGGDGEDRGGGHGVAVGLVATDALHELMHDVVGKSVDAVVIVAVLGEVALDVEVDDDTCSSRTG